jgi:Cu/Ag efflux protein CusF
MRKKSKSAPAFILLLLGSLLLGSLLLGGEALLAQSHGGHNHGGTAAPGDAYGGEGVVKAMADGKITIAHEAIPQLRWGPMTMDFIIQDPALLEDIEVGDKVYFTFVPRGRSHIIVEIEVI